MKKKILIGSILAVALLTLVSFTSVVGYSSVENNPDATPIEFELQRIRELVQSIGLREIIVNPDGALETLEEISSILEEEDVRNYIEETSEEDCGCEEDSSELEWFFPIICTLLLPAWTIALFIYFSTQRMFGVILVDTMAQIGYNLNCLWGWD